MVSSHAVMIAAAMLVASASLHAGTIITYDTIQLSGDAAPGTGGAVFDEWVFNGEPIPVTPFITPDGVAYFYTFLEPDPTLGIDSTNNFGAWSNESGVFAPLLRTGDVAPQTNGAVFEDFRIVQRTVGGPMVVWGRLATAHPDVDPSNDWGVWRYDASGAELVFREGDPAPGTDGSVFFELSDVLANSSGDIAILAKLVIGQGDEVDGSTWFGL